MRDYPALWDRMITQWSSPQDEEDCVWLTYSANYLLRTGGVRWAVDPMTLQGILAMSNGFNNPHEPFPFEQLCRLKILSFVLLTHRHGDHMDLGMIRALREFPIRWVIPDHMVEFVIEHTDLPRESIVVPQNGRPFMIEGIRITPFEGLHWETLPNGKTTGIDSTGYLVETRRQKLLFPGDVRFYDAVSLRWIGPVDWLFAHLWFGRDSADLPEPPLGEPFGRFVSDLQPRNVLLTHLREICRDEKNYWDQPHVEVAESCLRQRVPLATIDAPQIGQRVEL